MPFPAMIPLALKLATIAPSIVGMITGSKASEAVAEKAVQLAQAVTGASGPEEAVAATLTDPSARLAFQEKVLSMHNELEALYLADRADARARDVEMRKTGYRNIRADILAIVAVAALAGLAWLMVFVEVAAGPGRDILLMLTGALVKLTGDVYAFEFGSSRGSKEKSMLLSSNGTGV